MELGEFQVFLNTMLSNDSATESTLRYEEMLKENTSLVILLHYDVITECENESLKKMSAILLGRLFKQFKSQGIPEDLSQEALECIQTRTITLFQDENFSQQLMQQISALSATIVSIFLEEKMMKDFIPTLITIAKTFHPVISAAAVDCLGQILSYTPKQLKKYQADALQIVCSGIEQEISEQFVVYALNLLYGIVVRVHPRINLTEYSAVITPAIQELVATPLIGEAIKSLYGFVQHRVGFFGENIRDLITMLLDIIGNTSLASGVRTSSMEIITWIAKTSATGFAPFIEQAFTALLAVQDESLTEEYLDEEDVDLSIVDITDSTLAVFTSLYGNKSSFPSKALTVVTQAVDSEEWQIRRNALSALDNIIKAFGSQLSKKDNIESIATAIFEHFDDDSPPVRNIAYFAFATASKVFSPDIENDYHAEVMSALTNAVCQETCKKTRISAINALSRYCENCTSEILDQYADGLMQQLTDIVTEQEPEEQIQIMKCISYLSYASQESFTEFYPFFIQWLKEVISSYTPASQSPLRASAIQTYPIIGKAIDPETFAPDAAELFDQLLTEDWNEMCDAEFDAVQYAIREIAYYIPDSFTQYAPKILEILFAIANQPVVPVNTDMKSEDTTSCELFSLSNGSSYSKDQLKKIREVVLTINGILEEIPSDALEYTEEIADLCYKVCTYKFFPEAQIAAISCFVQLLYNIIRAESPMTAEFAEKLMSTIIQLISDEKDEPSVVTRLLELLIDTIDALARCSVDCSDVVSDVVQISTAQMLNSHERRDVYNERGLSNGENTMEYLSEDDLIEQVGLVVRCCFRNFPAVTMKFFDELSQIDDPIFQLMLRTDAICFSDTQPPGNDIPSLITFILACVGDQRMNVIRTAFICFADMIYYEKIENQEELDAVMQRAVALINHFEDSEDSTNLLAIDGAVVALAAIFKLQETVKPEILQLWFQQLPMEKTIPESSFVIQFLTEKINSSDPTILNEENMEQILTVLSNAALDNRMTTEASTAAKECIISMHESEALKESFEEAQSSLETDNRIAVQRVLDE